MTKTNDNEDDAARELYYLTQNPLSLLFFADDPIPEPRFDLLLPTWTPSPFFFINDAIPLLPSTDLPNKMNNNDEDDADDDDSWFDRPPIPLSFFSQLPNAPPGCGMLNFDSFLTDADDDPWFDQPKMPPPQPKPDYNANEDDDWDYIAARMMTGTTPIISSPLLVPNGLVSHLNRSDICISGVLKTTH